jgi:hypothetical protein
MKDKSRKYKHSVCKPCWELKYCPYGPHVEQFPLHPEEANVQDIKTLYRTVLSGPAKGEYKTESEIRHAASRLELRPEYKREDFGAMVRGKYAARMKESSNIIVLYPDIADAFPNAEAVNQTLRQLLELAKPGAQTSFVRL